MYLTFNNKTDKVFVDKVHSINIEEQYKDPAFEVDSFPESERQPTGLLPIFSLNSKEESLSFVCRWDQNPEEVDIDMYLDGKIVAEFKSKNNGYEGHHTTRVSQDTRKFKIDVQVPGRVIYQGYVTLNISHTIEINNLDRDIHIDTDPKNPGHIIIT